MHPNCSWCKQPHLYCRCGDRRWERALPEPASSPLLHIGGSWSPAQMAKGEGK